MAKRVLIIDNFDSFTFNLAQYFEILGTEVLVKRNHEITIDQAQGLKPDYLVFSPGPGNVENANDIGICTILLQTFQSQIPILGVCLGHQLLGYAFGGRIKKVRPVHGKPWPIRVISDSILFQELPSKFSAMRYHSLVVDRQQFPKNLQITAETDDQDTLIMALENKSLRLYGIQFHPESIGTPTGLQILENFLQWA